MDLILCWHQTLAGFKQPTGTTLLTMNQADFNTQDKYPNKQCGALANLHYL